MPYRQRKDYIELGKVQIVPKRKKINWPAETKDVWRIQQRIKTLKGDKSSIYKTVTNRENTKIEEAKQIASLLSLRPKKRRAEIRDVVESFLYSKIGQYERLGIPANELRKKLANSNLIVDKILNLKETKEERRAQKINLLLITGLDEFYRRRKIIKTKRDILRKYR